MYTNLTGIAETLLITTRVRAYETTRPDALLVDPWAVKIIEQLELTASNKDKLSSGTSIGSIMRTLMFDEKINAFIQQHSDAVIVNLGCGLDARYQRLCPSSITWFDLDIAESLNVRKQFFEEAANYQMLEKSMFDASWMDQIPKDKPIMIFFEGVAMYFPEEWLKPLIQKIFQQFPQADIMFDVISKLIAKNSHKHPDVKKYNVSFKWGIHSATELMKWADGICVISEESYMFKPPLSRWPILMRSLRWLPAVQRMGRVIHLKYEDPTTA